MRIEQEKFLDGYLKAALWSSTDDNSEPLDKNYNLEDFSETALEIARKDCAAFQEANATDLEDIDCEQAGHDFWLTRNHHGAGFWDRGHGAKGDRLTEAAHVYGSVDLFVAANGLIY